MNKRGNWTKATVKLHKFPTLYSQNHFGLKFLELPLISNQWSVQVCYQDEREQETRTISEFIPNPPRETSQPNHLSSCIRSY